MCNNNNPFATSYAYPPPRAYYPSAGGYTGFPSTIYPNRAGNISFDAKTLIENKILKEDDVKQLLGIDKTSQVCNGVAGFAGLAASLTNMGFQIYFQDRAMDQQDKYMSNMQELAKKEINLQKDLAQIQAQILESKDDADIEKTQILANLAIEKEEIRSKTSIANTKTVASYGFLDNTFNSMYSYGTPAIPSKVFV